MSRIPRIGITVNPLVPDWCTGQGMFYKESVRTAGGEPVPLTMNGASPEDQLSGLDGLVLSGGGDVDPEFYGAAPDGTNMARVSRSRDQWEMGLFNAALKTHIPVLGICRGAQVINVAMGGTLLQDVPGHQSRTRGSRIAFYHYVRVLDTSRSGDEEYIAVNSYHHQAVTPDRLAPTLRPLAYTESEPILVEAFESKNGTPVLGVQWHPERMLEKMIGRRGVFEWLVSEARRRR